VGFTLLQDIFAIRQDMFAIRQNPTAELRSIGMFW